MSSSAAAPSNASMMAWVSTSTSLWPNRPWVCSISTPPSISSRVVTSGTRHTQAGAHDAPARYCASAMSSCVVSDIDPVASIG